MLLHRSLLSLSARCCRRKKNQFRSFSRTICKEQEHHPLFLCLGDGEQQESSSSFPILRPPSSSVIESTVESPEDILKEVNDHYDKEQQFVGGMGEQDLGVWFVSGGKSNQDPVEFVDICQQGIELVKQERHGIPFGLYTSGLVFPATIPISEIGLATLQVSLYAASPSDYAKATGKSEKDFGTVCGFIVDAVEQGMAVEVGVLEEYSGPARDLAISLGAQNVHVYSP